MVDLSIKQGCLRTMTDADLGSVLELRNHPEIRRYMLTQHEITIEEHISWFERATINENQELLVFELDKICCGFVQFKNTNFCGVFDWGFYVAPGAPKGIGGKLGSAALEHAFKNEKLHKICGQALHWNVPSIEFHKSLGFVQEGILRDQHFDGSSFHSLICFGILRQEWVATNF
jgi:UDP-4-amino-4,6-dideoxy-N-acetyl-beta-L-altrosamine N-acetyltransferase